MAAECFQMCFLGTQRTTRHVAASYRHTPRRLIDPKLCNSHQKHHQWINSFKGKRKNLCFDLGRNCTFFLNEERKGQKLKNQF